MDETVELSKCSVLEVSDVCMEWEPKRLRRVDIIDMWEPQTGVSGGTGPSFCYREAKQGQGEMPRGRDGVVVNFKMGNWRDCQRQDDKQRQDDDKKQNNGCANLCEPLEL